MSISTETMSALLGPYLWSLLRISTLVLVTPVFGSQLIPLRIRLILIVMLALIIAPTIKSVSTFDGLSATFFLLIAQQLLIGLAMGFVLQLVMQAFVIAGQLITMQSGLGFANLVTPCSDISVPLGGQFYLLLFTLIFLAMNGHLMVIQVLIDSFDKLPITPMSISSDALWHLIQFSSWMFKAALLVSLPCIISLLLVNLAFGVLTRAVPQLNIFAVGFPIMLILGIMFMYLTLAGFLPHIETMIEKGIYFASNWLTI